MAFSIKTSISFGLVYIPVSLEAAVKKNEISFHQLDKNTGSRIRYKKTCDECDGNEVAPQDIVKAYQYEKGLYVTLDDKDLDKIKTKKDKSIAIERFVDLNEIDPVYYDKPFFVQPAGADKAYLLLKEAMERENKVGIAKTVMGTKETLVAVTVRGGQMMLSTMHFYDEIKNSTVKANGEVNMQELELACSIIQNMSGEFKPEEYKDEYTAKVMAAIGQKIAGKEITAPKESAGKIVDLMEALKQSLLSSAAVKPAKPLQGGTSRPATKPKSTGQDKDKNKKLSGKNKSGDSTKAAKKPAAAAKSR